MTALILVVVYTWRDERVRLISARPRPAKRCGNMKKEYDFGKGRRGAVLKPAPGKTRVTIRLDDDVLDWFRQQGDDAGGGNYQTLINEALRSFMHLKQESLETTLRRVIRDEIRRAGRNSTTRLLRPSMRPSALRASSRPNTSIPRDSAVKSTASSETRSASPARLAKPRRRA